MSRVKQKLVSAVDGEEVARDQILKGYAIGAEQYVTVSEDELAAIMPAAQRTIDLEEFVDLTDIDPVFYDSAYYLVPEKAAVKPYALLVEAMETAGKVGIARFVMRSKEYVAALRVRDGQARAQHDGVRRRAERRSTSCPSSTRPGKVELTDREKTMAQTLVESLSADFEPEKYHDTYREQLLEHPRPQGGGGDRDRAASRRPQSETKVVDLLAALEASVADAKAARKRHPTRPARSTPHAEDEADDADEQRPPRARPPPQVRLTAACATPHHPAPVHPPRRAISRSATHPRPPHRITLRCSVTVGDSNSMSPIGRPEPARDGRVVGRSPGGATWCPRGGDAPGGSAVGLVTMSWCGMMVRGRGCRVRRLARAVSFAGCSSMSHHRVDPCTQKAAPGRDAGAASSPCERLSAVARRAGSATRPTSAGRRREVARRAPRPPAAAVAPARAARRPPARRPTADGAATRARRGHPALGPPAPAGLPGACCGGAARARRSSSCTSCCTATRLAVAGSHAVKALADALGYEVDGGRCRRVRRGVYELDPSRPARSRARCGPAARRSARCSPG